MQLMHRATDYREPVDRGSEKKNVADNGTMHWDIVKRAEIMGGKREVRKTNFQVGNVEKIMSPSTQNMKFFKWGETKTNKATTDIGYQQKLNEFPAQLELEVKEIDDGLKEDKSKPKKKK